MAASDLEQRLHLLRTTETLPASLIETFRTFLLSAPDEALFRMSPLRWAADHGVSEQQAIDLFLYATHAGILEFAWGILCPGCLAFLTTPGALRTIDRRHCGFCSLDIKRSFDDRVEVAFTVSPTVRPIRFHSPVSLDLRQDALRLYFSSSLAPGSPPHQALAAGIMHADRVPACGEQTVLLNLEPGDTVLLSPAQHAACCLAASPTSEGPRSVSVEIFNGYAIPEDIEVPTGKVEVRIQNRLSQPVGYLFSPSGTLWPEAAPPGEPIAHAVLPYMTGPRLIMSQTFRELFRAASIPAEGGLEVKGTTLLFTDLKGSTALYERIGDIAAYDLVRRHFVILRRIIAAEGGAIVKTIGDAVMASFAHPMAAVQAVTRMNQQLQLLNEDSLHLKIGLHTGTCIAVELNDQLDYFGRTVNIAARVQGLAGPGEIVCTSCVYEIDGVPEAIARAGFAVQHAQVPLRGINGDVAVVRCRAQAP